jgi:hypothetical protein
MRNRPTAHHATPAQRIQYVTVVIGSFMIHLHFDDLNWKRRCLTAALPMGMPVAGCQLSAFGQAVLPIADSPIDEPIDVALGFTGAPPARAHHALRRSVSAKMAVTSVRTEAGGFRSPRSSSHAGQSTKYPAKRNFRSGDASMPSVETASRKVIRATRPH